MIECTDPSIVQIVSSQSRGVLVVYVWMANCHLNEKMRPALLKMEEEFPKAAFASIEDRRARLFCAAHAVRWFPTLLVFRRGIPITQMVSFGGEEELREFLKVSFKAVETAYEEGN